MIRRRRRPIKLYSTRIGKNKEKSRPMMQRQTFMMVLLWR